MSTKVADSAVSELEAFFLTRTGWQTWTPTVVQNVAVAVTVTYARYVVLAQTVIVQVRLVVTGAGTAGNDVRIQGIPSAIAPNRVDGSTAVAVCGTAVVFDTGTAFYQGALVAVGANDLRITCHNQTNRLGATPNFALANGDVISFQGAWERA